MKTNSNSLFATISNETLTTLTLEVKETLATGLTNTKKFSTVDLWNIRRKSRSAVGRRSFV